MTVADWITELETFAPPCLAEKWDNVGLLVGDRTATAERVLTCLTLTPDVAAEAIDRRVQLIISHHPVLFHATQRITDDTVEGAMLLSLIQAGVAIYSPHTAFDSTWQGINQSIAEGLELEEITPLKPFLSTQTDCPQTDGTISSVGSRPLGSGRRGRFRTPIPLGHFVRQVGTLLRATGIQFVGDPTQQIDTVGIACGAAANFLSDARQAGCDVFLTGEARFHDCLEARSTGIALVLPGHFATERPAVEALANRLLARFPDCSVMASAVESDPLEWRML